MDRARSISTAMGLSCNFLEPVFTDVFSGDFVYIGDLLIEHHPAKVGMPHVKYIKEKLWEMRLSGINNIARAIYTIDKKVIIVLHLFITKMQKTPNQAIKIAQKRMKEVKL